MLSDLGNNGWSLRGEAVDLAGVWRGREHVLKVTEPRGLVGKGRLYRAAVSHAAVSGNCDHVQAAEKCAESQGDQSWEVFPSP